MICSRICRRLTISLSRSPRTSSVTLWKAPPGLSVEQYADGTQTMLAEVRDATLKPGGSYYKCVLEVRGDRLSLSVNRRPLLEQVLPPPPRSRRGAAARARRGGRGERAARGEPRRGEPGQAA